MPRFTHVAGVCQWFIMHAREIEIVVWLREVFQRYWNHSRNDEVDGP